MHTMIFIVFYCTLCNSIGIDANRCNTAAMRVFKFAFSNYRLGNTGERAAKNIGVAKMEIQLKIIEASAFQERIPAVLLIGNDLSIFVDASSNSITIEGNYQKMNYIKRMANALDVRRASRIYNLINIDYMTASKLIRLELSKFDNIDTTIAQHRSKDNSVVITARESIIDRISEIIKKIDIVMP